MATTVRLLPDPAQHELLVSTLQRVNRASNSARSAALERPGLRPAELRALVREELERQKLPATFVTPALERVRAALGDAPGKRQRFSEYQSLALPAAALRWSTSDRVTLPTAAGRRTVRVYVDPTRGSLRPPLADRPATLVFRNGEFELVDAGA